MREYFRGWRRKAGCVTLVMALALMGMWFRGWVATDYLTISVQRHAALDVTLEDRFVVFTYKWVNEGSPDDSLQEKWFAWDSKYLDWSAVGKSEDQRMLLFPIIRSDQWIMTRFMAPPLAGRCVLLAMPLLISSLFFSAISAYLLLWKPRQRMGGDHA